MKSVVRRSLPPASQRWLRRRWYGASYVPPVGQVNFGDLHRVMPISRQWGYGRGTPIDRHYVERFLSHHAQDIAGRVLEIKDAHYTRKFGGDRVTHSDVLDVKSDNPHATMIGDITCAEHIPSESYDCVIFTQTLLLIYDFRAALHTVHRILKTGGVVLATLPNITQIARDDKHEWQDYWRFTDASARRLFGEFFPPGGVEVDAHGNVLAATAFLHGLSAHELKPEELDYQDPDYQITIAVRAVKRSDISSDARQ